MRAASDCVNDPQGAFGIFAQRFQRLPVLAGHALKYTADHRSRGSHVLLAGRSQICADARGHIARRMEHGIFHVDPGSKRGRIFGIPKELIMSHTPLRPALIVDPHPRGIAQKSNLPLGIQFIDAVSL